MFHGSYVGYAHFPQDFQINIDTPISSLRCFLSDWLSYFHTRCRYGLSLEPWIVTFLLCLGRLSILEEFSIPSVSFLTNLLFPGFHGCRRRVTVVSLL